MNATNSENLEQRFDAGESVLDYFDTDVVLTVDGLADLARILNMSALSSVISCHNHVSGIAEAGTPVCPWPERQENHE